MAHLIGDIERLREHLEIDESGQTVLVACESGTKWGCEAQRSGPCHQPQSGAFSQVRRLGLTPFSVARPVFGLISGAPLTRNNSPVWGW
jgi:hypothetical protein